MEIDRPEVTRAFNEYIEPYDMTDDKIRLKAGHTYRVAGLSHRIAEDIGLSGEDVDLAWLIGVLHDIGRFEQLRRYNTFSDADSIDHAEFGADLLFKEGLIDRFFKGTAEEKDLIETAIRMHNIFELPEDLTEREYLFSTILRDADKVDIFRVNTEFPLPVIYNTTDELLRTSKLTPEVTEASNSHITVLKAIRKTPLDVIVGHMSLAYGLVYPVSYRITIEQGYLEQLMGFRTEDPDTNRELEKITSEIRGWMESHSR
ncbi:MAG: HD domain-containing protein [Lachnospiraceae bacterium]|nr:HD domain-containing protein [Lachnospiraceae bacterium]